MRIAITVVGAIIVMLIFLGPGAQGALYTVDETQLAVITRFGEIRSIHTKPGLKVKAPFVDSVNRFDRRLLRIDTKPSTLNDIDKFNLLIDAYTRYRITDVELFFENLRTISNAEQRIGSIVSSNLKEEIARRTRQEIIGGRTIEMEDGERSVIATNTRQEILSTVLAAANREVGPSRKYLPVPIATGLGMQIRQDEVFEIGEEDFIEVEEDLAAQVDDDLVVTLGDNLGVVLLDVRMKRADFSADVQDDIFKRMQAERERISRETRALGAEQDAKIRAEVNKDRAIILADAQKQANLTKGEGEAKAVEIFAEALQQDPEFFAFQRSLEAYKKFLATNSTVVLSSESQLFSVLQSTDQIPVETLTALVGPIESMSGNVWTVGGKTVTISGATIVNFPSAPDIGLTVFAKGNERDDGTLEASQVTEGMSGVLERISLARMTLDDQIVVTNSATDILVDPTMVATVYVEGQFVGKELVATQITEGLRGTLESTGDTTWTVDITDFSVNDNTEIGEGADQPGGDVLVAVRRRSDDSLVALKIFLQPPAGGAEQEASQPADPTVRLVGAVESFIHEWKIRGSSLVAIVDENTNVQLGADQVGLSVLIGFERQNDGSILALEARIEPRG